ncbi:MAG: tRNA pseudouridine(13) synthase TruD [Candidatus Woesearchaeota archaeon]
MLIKHNPEDFIVEEIPLNNWLNEGRYAVFKMTKHSLDTEQALNIIIKRFHLTEGIIKYSGTKDKHAKTTQYISIPNNAGINQIRLNDKDIKLEHVGYSDEPLSLGTLKGNKFIITLRALNSAELESLNSIKRFIDSPNDQNLIVPNYFDEQRFSSNNVNIGLCILRKDYKKVVEYLCENNDSYSEKSKEYLNNNPNDYIGTLRYIPKKTLLMFIHAVQSYLFNLALSKILFKEVADNNNSSNNSINSNNTVKDIILKYSMGEFVFYNASNIQDINNKYTLIKNKTIELELIGFNTLNMNAYIKASLDELKLVQRDFIIRAIPNLSVEGTTRECFVTVEKLSINIDKTDTNVAIIEFELPKGSYATIVIKALVNNINKI